MARRQNLREQILEEIFSEAPSQFRRSKYVLKRGDILPDLVNLAIRFLQPAKTFLHVADDPRCMIEPLAEGLLRLVEDLRILLQSLVYLPRHLAKLLLNRL